MSAWDGGAWGGGAWPEPQSPTADWRPLTDAGVSALELSGLAFVADPAASSTLTLSGSEVTAMTDASGLSGLTLARLGGAGTGLTLDSTTTLNGYPTLAMATGKGLQTASGGITGSADHAIIALWRGTFGAFKSFARFGADGSEANSVIGVELNADGRSAWGGNNPNTSPTGTPDIYFSTTQDLQDNTWYLLTMECVGKAKRIRVNGYLCTNLDNGTLPTTDNALNISAGLGLTSYAANQQPAGNIAHAVWLTTVSAGQRRAYERYVRQRYNFTTPINVACLGDSQMAGAYASATQYNLPSRVSSGLTALGYSVRCPNKGQSGYTIAQKDATVEADVAGNTSGLSARNVALVLVGINSIQQPIATQYTGGQHTAALLGVGLGASAFEDLVTYCADIRANGAEVVIVCTLPPQCIFGIGDPRTVATQRELDIFNDRIRKGWSTRLKADDVADLDTFIRPYLGAPDGSYPDFSNPVVLTILNTDLLHFRDDGTTAHQGYAVIAPLITTKIAAFLTPGS